MGTISLQVPQVGAPNTTEDVKVASDFTTLQTLLNGDVDTNNLSPTAGIKRAQLALGAGFPNNFKIVTANTTAAYGDFVVPGPTSASITVTLPAALQGGMVGIYAGLGTTSVNHIVVAASGGANIFLPPSTFAASWSLSSVGTSWLLLSDGTNWLVPFAISGASGPPDR